MSGQTLYLALAVAAFGLFAVTLMTTHIWSRGGDR
jgi:hypothetical protein